MRILFVLLLLTCAGAAPAFQEDICPNGAEGWRACILNPCEAGDEAAHCGIASAVTALSSTFLVPATGKGARSTIHFDATYLLAQAAGYSARDAYVIAAYDAAVDMGQYVHRDQQGRLVVDPADCRQDASLPACALLSQTLGGVVRNNFAEGGLFYHFMAAAHAEVIGEGLAPAVDDARREPFLFHLRRWTYGQGPLCVAGLTDTAGRTCFISAVRDAASLAGRMPYESEGGVLTSVDWVSAIAEQTVATDPVSGANTPASELGRYIAPEDLPLARLGIYLHALADRISHYRCIDASDVQGPRSADAGAVALNPLMDLLYQTALHLGTLPAYLQSLQPTPPLHDPDYLFLYDVNECDQSNHFLRHSWETGHDHRALAPENQTARHGLRAVLDELIRHAATHRLGSARSLDASARDELVEALLDATDVAEPQARVDALTTLAQQRGWRPLPLHGGVSLEQWQATAGPAMFQGDAVRAETQGGGALDRFAILLLMMILCLPRRWPGAGRAS